MRKLFRWRIDALEMEEKQQELQEETVKNTEKNSELLEHVGAVNTETERVRAGAKVKEDGRSWLETQRKRYGEKTNSKRESVRMVG